ncbi:MAG TPA: phosphoglycerate kinase [Anaerolineae bacterium]|nr:phosphoglycerate kinase [Anaerolineae bacterium]
MNKKTVRDVDVQGKRVLMRVDFNVPLQDGGITDDTRIQAALPTIEYLLDGGAALILMSHLGRPKGKAVPELSLKPVAVRLGELLGRDVQMAPDCVGEKVEEMAEALEPGDVLLLQNTRFHAGEEKNDPAMAEQLARLGDLFVNDAFGAAHRAHASTEGVTHYLPAVAGLLMEKEIEFLGKAIESPEHPYIAIIGGAKISDKIGVIRNLLKQVDVLLIGGGMANTFLAAQGYEMGDSLVEADSIAVAEGLMGEGGEKLVLPVDAVVADAFAADAARKVVPVDAIEPGWRMLDIGPKTVALFVSKLEGAKTVVWNGPMGVFEFEPFAAGTLAVAQMLAESDATTIIGGGDSVAAIQQAGLSDQMSHISTGGGASLEMLEGQTLPGLAALDDK